MHCDNQLIHPFPCKREINKSKIFGIKFLTIPTLAIIMHCDHQFIGPPINLLIKMKIAKYYWIYMWRIMVAN